MVESVRVPGKGTIRATIENLSRRVSKKGRTNVSTRKWLNPGEYEENVESVRVPKIYPDGYRRRVESM